MPRNPNPKMRSRAEIESALRFARNRLAAEEAADNKTPEFCLLYQGQITAYEFVLRLESGEWPKVADQQSDKTPPVSQP